MTTPAYPRPLPPNSSEAGQTQTAGDDHHNNKGGIHHTHVKKKRKKHSPKDHTVIKSAGIKHHDHKRHQHHHESHHESKHKDNHHVIGGHDKDDDDGTNTGGALAQYMRAKTIVFKATGLKPNTRYYPFFNDKFVGSYCSTTDGAQTSTIVTNSIGDVVGNFYLPASTFLAGHHTFKLVDSIVVDSNSNTIPAPGYTEAHAEYEASGILKQLQTDVTPETDNNPVKPPPPPCPTAPKPPMVIKYTRTVTTTSASWGIIVGITVNDKVTTTTETKILPSTSLPPENGKSTVNSPLELMQVITGGLVNNIYTKKTYSNWVASDPYVDPNWKAASQPYCDPLAQSFYVESNKYPDGMYTTAIDVFFKKVDQTCPVTLELRNMQNGVPGSTILPGGKVTLPGYSISSSANATTATKFKFDKPVFLQPNTEYCFVLKSTSMGYEAWVSKFNAIDITGQTTTTTTNVVTIPAVAPVYSTTNKNQTFTTAGSATFTVPDGVTSLKVLAIGGGGGGGNGRGASGIPDGGAAGQIIDKKIAVQPGDVLNLVVGTGGAGVPYDGSVVAGGNGTSSTIVHKRGLTTLETDTADGGTGGKTTNGTSMNGRASGAPFNGAGGVGTYGNYNGLPGTLGSGGGGVDGSATGKSSGKGGDGAIYISYTQTVLVTEGTPETTKIVSSSSTTPGTLITQQPFGGVLFKSANDHTWTPDQFEDLKFNLYVAEFDIANTGNLVFKPQKDVSNNVYYNTARNLLLSSLSTTIGTSNVNITIPMHALSNGDKIFIKHMPSNIVNGIDLTNLIGEFEVSVVDEDTVTITALNSDTADITGPMVSSDFVHEINTIPPVIPATLSNPIATVEPNSGNNSPVTIPIYPVDPLPPTPPESLGDYSFTVYANVQANEVMIDYMGTEVAGTGIKEYVKMANGQSTAGTEIPYEANDYLLIDKDGVFHSFDEPRLLANPANETQHHEELNDDVSTKVNINLDSLNKYVSPVVDTNGISLMIKTHVIDNQGGEIEACTIESDFNDVTQNSEIGAGTGNAAAKYKTKIVQLKDSAKEISIFINANVPNPAVVDCYIRTSNDPTTHMDRPWNWVNLDGVFGTAFKNSPDKNTINEYHFDYTAAERFNTFDLKFVMRSTNNSIVPKIFSVRTMTIIDNS